MGSNVRFAHEQSIMAGTEMGLQRLVIKLNDTAKNFGMKINVQKTKNMVVFWVGGGAVSSTVDGKRIEQSQKFQILRFSYYRRQE